MFFNKREKDAEKIDEEYAWLNKISDEQTYVSWDAYCKNNQIKDNSKVKPDRENTGRFLIAVLNAANRLSDEQGTLTTFLNDINKKFRTINPVPYVRGKTAWVCVDSDVTTALTDEETRNHAEAISRQIIKSLAGKNDELLIKAFFYTPMRVLIPLEEIYHALKVKTSIQNTIDYLNAEFTQYYVPVIPKPETGDINQFTNIFTTQYKDSMTKSSADFVLQVPPDSTRRQKIYANKPNYCFASIKTYDESKNQFIIDKLVPKKDFENDKWILFYSSLNEKAKRQSSYSNNDTIRINTFNQGTRLEETTNIICNAFVNHNFNPETISAMLSTLQQNPFKDTDERALQKLCRNQKVWKRLKLSLETYTDCVKNEKDKEKLPAYKTAYENSYMHLIDKDHIFEKAYEQRKNEEP